MDSSRIINTYAADGTKLRSVYIYNKEGVDALMKSYPVDKFDSLTYTQIQYLGWLLWSHNICLSYDFEYHRWYIER